jgi:23S rRNA (pseudouridine1915-N3)-methyltransferase
MKYRILCVGKVKEDFYRKRISELSKEIQKTDAIQLIEVEDEKTSENLSEIERTRILQIEGDRLLRVLPYNPRELVVALCIDGKQYTTDAWGMQLHALAEQRDCNQITYIIGGSLGLDENVVKRADIRLSFSKLTFPHQLMRVMLMEQIVRTCTYL